MAITNTGEAEIKHSCFYECSITHERFAPKTHRFAVKAFLFAIDLDEVELLFNKLPGFGPQWWQPYRWVDADWMPAGLIDSHNNDLSLRTVKERVCAFLNQDGLDVSGGRVMWVGQPRVFGFGYNPASFFVCWDSKENPLAALLLVDNTFRELKPYIIPANKVNSAETMFSDVLTKHFYVSPFLNLDDEFNCSISLPEGYFSAKISTQRDETTLLKASLLGQRKPISETTLFRLSIKYPLFPQFTMLAIHCHAALLFLKGIPFHLKQANEGLQRGFLSWRNRLSVDP